MAGYNLRSWQKHSVGRVLITLIHDPVTTDPQLASHRALAGAAGQLLACCQQLRLPVTWAMTDPVVCPTTRAVLAGTTAAEIAVLWSDEAGERPVRLCQEIGRARSAGIPLTTVVHHPAAGPFAADWIARQAITAVAEVEPAATKSPRFVVPRALHYGVWQLPITGWLTGRNSWFARRGLLRCMRRATGEAGTVHLAVDLPACIAGGSDRLGNLSAMLGQVAKLRDRSFVKLETLSELAARLSNVPASTPQRSILRRAG